MGNAWAHRFPGGALRGIHLTFKNEELRIFSSLLSAGVIPHIHKSLIGKKGQQKTA